MQSVSFGLREDLDTLPSKQCCGHANTIVPFATEASVVKESASAGTQIGGQSKSKR
jgi:hypothetical protein